MGVRFIAVNNSFDSMKLNNGTPGIEVAVSNLVNNMYSRDIAKRFGLLWKRTGRTGKPPARMSLLDMCGTRKGGSGGRLTRRQHPA